MTDLANERAGCGAAVETSQRLIINPSPNDSVDAAWTIPNSYLNQCQQVK
jgi:hypothetical protein